MYTLPLYKCACNFWVLAKFVGSPPCEKDLADMQNHWVAKLQFVDDLILVKGFYRNTSVFVVDTIFRLGQTNCAYLIVFRNLVNYDIHVQLYTENIEKYDAKKDNAKKDNAKKDNAKKGMPKRTETSCGCPMHFYIPTSLRCVTYQHSTFTPIASA